MGPLEDRGTWGSLGGVHFIPGATWPPPEGRGTWASSGGVHFILGATWAPLRTEALGNALAVFTSV